MVGWVTIYYHSVWTGFSFFVCRQSRAFSGEWGWVRTFFMFTRIILTDKISWLWHKKGKSDWWSSIIRARSTALERTVSPSLMWDGTGDLTTVSSSRQAAAMWMETTKRNTLKPCCFGENGNQTPCCLHATKMGQPAICMSRCSWFPSVSPSRHPVKNRTGWQVAKEFMQCRRTLSKHRPLCVCRQFLLQFVQAAFL